ncbi:MAG TPA: glycosyltransferase family 4 protein [Firmicutes bacterium]|nr:glycosyltransferase family 4 protein [Bacillota bacterium]
MDLLITGPVFDATGYAEILRNIALGLDQSGVNIRLEPRNLGQAMAPLPAATEEALRRMAGGMASGGASKPGVALHIFLAGFFMPVAGMFNIGLTMLEVDRVPADWVARCNMMDEIWVPSSFNLETFSASGVKREIIRVMQLGVDVKKFSPAGAPLEVPGLRGFVFLSVFEWILRKGYDLLLPAFLAEFGPEEDVSLLLKVHDNSGYDPAGASIRAYVDEVCRSMGRPTGQIVVISHVLPSDLMPALYRRANCFVLPTRGEGWNMPAIEAMASGLPVISTAWSGQMDFLQEAGAYLIEVEALEAVPMQGIANDKVYAGARWARPSVSHLRRLMRHVYERREEAAQVGLKAREVIRRRYSWDAAIAGMRARLAELS